MSRGCTRPAARSDFADSDLPTVTLTEISVILPRKLSGQRSLRIFRFFFLDQVLVSRLSGNIDGDGFQHHGNRHNSGI